jgi:hypothetical protein
MPDSSQREVEHMSLHYNPGWFTDPAPDFRSILKEDDLRVIAAQQIDLTISAIDRQVALRQGELNDLATERKMLANLKTMIARR